MSKNLCANCQLNNFCITANLNQKNLRLTDDLSFNAKILSPGEHLIRQGEYLTHVYTVRSGCLKSYTVKENGDEYVMGFNFPAQLLGLDAFSKKKSLVSIVALEQSNICEIPILQFQKIIQSNIRQLRAKI